MTTYAEAYEESARIRDREIAAQHAARAEMRRLFRAVTTRARELRFELHLSAADAARRLAITVEQYMDTEDAASEDMTRALAALKMLELAAAQSAKREAQ